MAQMLTERCRDRRLGVLSCYDRIVITGTLPGISNAAGMTSFLYAKGIRVFDHAQFAKPAVGSNPGARRPVATARSQALLLSASLGLLLHPDARADEGGTSFWIPGQYASLAAVPPPPGWSIAAPTRRDV